MISPFLIWAPDLALFAAAVIAALVGWWIAERWS